MKNLYKKFNQAVRWNTAEAFIYQIALYLHSIAVSLVLGVSKFGAIGTIFSLIFLLITVLGLGFDKSLITNFNATTESKHSFKKFFVGQLFIQLALLSLALPIFIFLDNPLDIILCSAKQCYDIERYLWIVAAFTIISEGVHKSLKTLMQLAFKNKYTSMIEVITLAAYLLTVWLGYFITGKLTLQLIFVPFLAQSLVAVAALSWLTIRFYQSLPETNDSKLTWPAVWTIRQNSYIFQLSNTLFSSNLLVPLFAYKFGLSTAGYLKLFSYLGGIVMSLSEKIFGITGGALFVGLKENTTERTFAFNKIKRQFLSLLLLLSAIIVAVYLFSHHPTYSGAGVLFLLALVLENFYIIYEKYFLVKNQILKIVTVNLVCALIFFPFFWLINLSLGKTIVGLIAIRALAFVVISKRAEKT